MFLSFLSYFLSIAGITSIDTDTMETKEVSILRGKELDIEDTQEHINTANKPEETLNKDYSYDEDQFEIEIDDGENVESVAAFKNLPDDAKVRLLPS